MAKKAKDQVPAGSSGVAENQLCSFIERIERLEGEKSDISVDIREVYAEAKGVGFDVKAMRQIVKLRAMDPEERAAQEQLVDLYRRAVGLAPFGETPLGKSAEGKDGADAGVEAGAVH